MARRGDSILLMVLVLLGSLLVVNEQGSTIARVHERPGGYVDVFDQHGGRLGWGRQSRTGSVEIFDARSRRLLILEPERGVIQLRK